MHGQRNGRSTRLAKGPAAARGVTVIELMVAMAVSLVIIGAATTLFMHNSTARKELDRVAHLHENGRYAIQLLKDEISLAGFYGELAPADVTGDVSIPCSDDIVEWRDSMAASVHGINAGGFVAGFGCVQTAAATAIGGTGMLFSQRASTIDTAADAALLNTAYLQVSRCSDAAGWSLATSGFNEDATGWAAADCDAFAPIRRYLRHIYFVDANNEAGDGIPTLKRLELRAGQLPAGPQTLVEGVEALRFAFAVDTNNDGSPDEFTEATPVDAVELANFLPNIMGIQIWVLARALEESPGYHDTKTYQLGGLAIDPDDGFKRHVFSTYVELINPVGRREQ